jgi:hypothetical protein
VTFRLFRLLGYAPGFAVGMTKKKKILDYTVTHHPPFTIHFFPPSHAYPAYVGAHEEGKRI